MRTDDIMNQTSFCEELMKRLYHDVLTADISYYKHIRGKTCMQSDAIRLRRELLKLIKMLKDN